MVGVRNILSRFDGFMKRFSKLLTGREEETAWIWVLAKSASSTGCYVLTFDPAQNKMLFQGDAPEGSDTFQWPVIERDRVGGLRLIIWDKVKVPLCQYRLMHRKRVTSELHDSYFRLMTIKHSISKIQWAIV